MKYDQSVYDNETILVPDGDQLVRVHTQRIDDDFLNGLREEKAAKAGLRSKDWDKAVSVPTFVVDLWRRQGFDFFRMSVKETVAKLRADGLDAFVATEKSV